MPKQSVDVNAIHDYCISRETREIWIHGSKVDLVADNVESTEPGVEFMMANLACKNLLILERDNRRKPVTIHLHTCGGHWSEGMAIYDTIMAMPYRVRIISYTHARSMSSIILQAGDERYLLPHSYFMFHDGTLGTYGTVKQVFSDLEFTKRSSVQQMLDIYVAALREGGKFSHLEPAEIRKVLVDKMKEQEDVYLLPEEAVEWGFADGVLEKGL